MLCRAEFLAPPEKEAPDTGDPLAAAVENSRVRVFVPVAALASADTVWKVDRSGDRVAPQSIVPGPTVREGHRLVLEGLKPGDRVVLNPPADLESGDRFRPIASTAPESSPPTEQ
jgi:HlyD family secretion protein